MSVEPDSAGPTMDRRRFLRTTAMTVAVAGATAAGVSTTVMAESLDPDSNVVHAPWIEDTITVSELDLDDMALLDVINDDGEVESLSNYGAVLAPPEYENGEQEDPHNPVRYDPAKIVHSEFTDFPRGETYDDGDDEDLDVSWNISDLWLIDEDGGSIDLDEEGEGVTFTASGLSEGDHVSATFGEDEDSEFDVSSIGRNYLQVIMEIGSIDSDSVVTFALEDDDDNRVEATIEDGADLDDEEVISDGDAESVAYQGELGEFDGISDLGDVTTVEVTIEDGDAEFTVTALNIERASSWSFGRHEYEDEDDDLDVETVRGSQGPIDVIDLNDLDPFSNAKIEDIDIEVEYRAEELPQGSLEYEWTDPGAWDHDERLNKVYTFELPDFYDLSHDEPRLRDEVLYPGSRYVEVSYAIEDEDDDITLEDIDEDELSMEDETDTFESASPEDTITLTSSPSGGDYVGVFYDTLHTEKERDEAMTDSTIAVAAEEEDEGGLFNRVRLGVLTFAGIAAALLARARMAAPGV